MANLAEWGALSQGVGTIMGALAVAYAAWLGSGTFEIWRRQKLFERRIEQAERILTATYRARRALSVIRAPLIYPHEVASAEKMLKDAGRWDNTTEREQKRRSKARAYYNRFDG